MYWYARRGYVRHQWSNSLVETRRRAIEYQDRLPFESDMIIYDSGSSKAPVGKIYKRDGVRYWATEKGVYRLNENGKRRLRRTMR